MDKSETPEVNQDSGEETPLGGMDALRDAISASLTPQEDVQETTEQTPIPEQEDDATQQVIDQDQEEPEEAPQRGDYNWQKRVNKLTAQKKELEEQLHDLKQESFEQKQSQKPKEESSISELVTQAETQDDLDRLMDDALAAERWAKRSLSRYRRDPDSVEQEIEKRVGENMPDDVEVWLEDLALNAEYQRQSDIPKRRKQIEQQSQSFEFASTKYPWLRDPKNPARAWVDQVKQENPGIKNLQDVDLYLARSLVGFYVEQEQANKATKQTRTPDPTPQPGRPAATKPQVSDIDQRMKSARERVKKTGSRDGLKDWIKAAANI